MKHTLTFLTALLLAPLASLSAQTKAPAKPDPNFIATPAELQARIAKQLHITKPDFVVFVPEVSGGASDTGNEHFLVFDGPDGSLMAVWTQSSVENFSADTPPDQHIVFSQSTDEGKTWSKPRILAGPKRAGDGPMASWAYPLVSKKGRVYVLYSQSIDKTDCFVHHTGWLHGICSDDNGATWSRPQNIPVARSINDNPDPTMPPNMLCWQKPLRLGKDGKYFSGFTRWTSFAVRKPSPKSLGTADSRVEFMRFENVDDSPEPQDLKISWFMSNEKALAVPCASFPENSVCQEPSIVKLPDGRLFCVMRTSAGSPFWSVSSDTGETWTAPRRLLRKDGGEPLRHPVSPCPIYDVGGNEAGSGRYVLFIHDNDGNFKGYRPKPTVTGFNRRPIYLVTGRFQPGAEQPVWFDELKFFMDHDNVSLGKVGTNGRFDLSLYSSFTVRNRQPVLWYPDRKFFLLGHIIGNEWFAPSSHAASGNDLRARSTSEQAAERAFGCTQIKLGGVMGHRIDTMIKGNLLKIDVEKEFLSYSQTKKLKAGFRGTGLMLDAAVHLAAYSQQEELIRWKDHWIDELISTQDPDGYIGIIRPGPDRGAMNFDLSEKGCILLALVNDYRIFGRTKSIEAAKRLGDEFIASWNPKHFGKLWTCEYPLIALSEAAGDPKYVDWVRATFFPEGKLSPMWTHGLGGWPWGLGGNPLKPLNLEAHHAYRWCDINISMLYLNRHYPDPALRAGYPQIIAWIRDGGALAPGSFVLDERWRRSQTTRTGVDFDPEFVMGQVQRSKVGENCAKRYVVQLLHLAMKERPDPYYGDVMERTFYNGLFAGMSPTGRMLSYDLSVEGTRLANPADFFCCPGNLRRALAYLPGYFYYQQGNQIYFNLYGESDARLKLPGGGTIRLVQTTDYPASGKIRVTVETARPVEQELLFRVPAWCRNPQIRLHGKALSGVQSGSFFPVKREWKAGDGVELDLPMEWRWMRGIREQEGRAVLARGPIIYSLNPFSSGISNYVDLPVNVDDPWFSEKLTASWGHPRVLKEGNKIPLYEEHIKGFRALEDITLDTSSVSGPEADANVPFGSNVTVKGWLGSPKGAPARTFVFNSFDHPNGRKIYLKLADRSSEVDDELFGKEIHEKTVYPARWAAVKKGLDATAMEKVPDAGLDQALLIKPMRGSWETETTPGQLAGRPAWMSASLAQTGKRRMEFRVQDKQFRNGACSNVTLSVLYLDKGDCNVSLIYDSGDAVVHLRGGKPGAFKPGGEFQIGDTGAIKRHDFALPDARFARSLRDEGTDFRLVANKDADFVILGAFLQAPVKPAPNSLNAPSVKSGSTPASAGAQQAAFGVDRIKLGGVFGHRIETMIKGNLLKLDMAESYLSKYRNKKGKAGAFVGIGFPLDAMVRFCAFTGDEELTRLEDRWMDELIATQEPDGFIGTISPDEPRYGPKSVYAQVEMADTLLALVSDCQIFGRKKSLDAAVRLADCMVANWIAAPTPYNYIYDGELALMKLSDVSGDRKYLSWVKDKFLPPGGRLPEDWTRRLGGDPLKPLNLEGQHVYRWCDINLSMLYLNRHFPDPALRAGYPQMIAWRKDGGALAPGSFALDERWRRSQAARSALDHDPEFLWGQHDRTKCGENCAKLYVVQLLHLAMEERPDPFYGDVMERTFYNGLFAGMSPTGRMLSYDLSVEGTRIANPLDYYCCPGNLRRALAYLPGYFYYQQGAQIYFNLYGESDARLKLPGGGTIRLVQTTDYPASGRIRVTVETARPVEQELLFRVPAWCGKPEIRLNGKRLSGVQSGSFFPLKREWKAGDVVELSFPMEWRWMRGIREQEGRAVLARGPIIYSLNPFSSGISNYVDLPVNVDDAWFADHQTASWGHPRVLKKTNVIPGYTEHMKSFATLEHITLDASSVRGPAVDESVPFGSKVTVKGWLGSPNGPPNRTFVFNSFDHPNGRKIHLKLSDRSSEVDDELFGTEIHEKTVYPARWETVKKGLDAAAIAQVPDEGLAQAVQINPMRGSYEAETAQGELAGHPAWISCSLAKTGKRRMEFRVYDPKFQNGATPEVTLSVLYLDKGDCKVSLIYDSGDDVVRQRGREPGAFKPGGEFQIGNTGTIKRHDFKLPDARFGKNLLLEGTDFRLTANKDMDFVILGAFLQPGVVAPGSQRQPASSLHLKDYTDPARLPVAGGESASLHRARKNAFGVEELELNGIMGQRMMFTLDSIHMMDTDAIFVAPWRDRRPKKLEPFNGIGHTLEGLIFLAAYTGNQRDIALKDQIIGAILATMEDDGYVGRFAPGERGRQQQHHDSEDQLHFLRAVAIDAMVFGWKPGRRVAAEKMAKWIIDTWTDKGKQSVSGFDECLMALYEATGDKAYLDFTLKVSFPSNTFSSHGWGWQEWTGYDPVSDSFDLRNIHVYRGTAIAKEQLRINQLHPHPMLPRATAEIESYIKDGGAGLPATFGCNEAFSKSQFGRSGAFNPTMEYCRTTTYKCCEVCSRVYIAQLLETDWDLRRLDAWRYDVIERIIYNSFFAAQSREARPEWNGTKQRYDTAFEGPRTWFQWPIYCCPNNFRKYMGQLPRLMYKTRPDGIYVNLYEASRAVVHSGNGPITVTQNTAYPRDGKIVFRFDPERETKTAFYFRIPAWCSRPSLEVNGKTVENVRSDSYGAVSRTWKKGDVVELDLRMDWRWISGIRDQDGRAGLMRGPLVFALNPVVSKLPGYRDLVWEPADFIKAMKPSANAKEREEYQLSYDLLQNLVIDAGSLSAPVADRTVYGDGIAGKVKAWSRPENISGKPDLELILTEFPDEGGRKTYFLLNDQKVAQPDPLFARELKERTLFPKRWEAAKAGLVPTKLTKLPWSPSADDLLVPALRSSGDEMSAPGEVASHRAWMSVSELNRPYRKMGFRMPDGRFLDRIPGRVAVNIVYLDRGNCDVEVFYDSTDATWEVLKSPQAHVVLKNLQAFVAKKKGSFKPALRFTTGNSGEWRHATFELKNARFTTESDGKDLFLYINKNEDFIVQGVYVRELERGEKTRQEDAATAKKFD